LIRKGQPGQCAAFRLVTVTSSWRSVHLARFGPGRGDGGRGLLATVPGIGRHASAAAVISEIGVTVKEFFPDDAHLASWTGLCPGNHQSAGKRRSGKPRPGNTHLQTLLVECAWSAVRHDGYLKSLFHRHVMKNGGYRSSTA
jgi:transposase